MSADGTDRGVVAARPASEPESPMAADRRTLVIAAVAMVVLILVGVVSSALFARSACEVIDPTPVATGAAGSDVTSVLTAALPDLEEATRAELESAITTLAGEFGALTGVAEVPRARAATDAGAGVVAVGPVTYLLTDTGAATLAAVDVDQGAVRGSGDTLYSLAVGNELTGQVDALQPLDVSAGTDEPLAALTCQDTATIGTPLAFELDAADGDLLLLRIDEDGDEPDLQLRDPVAGEVWSSRLELGRAPAGMQGQWLSGGLGDERLVVGYRTAADTDAAEVPVLRALARDDGGELWTLGREDLAPVLDDQPQFVEVEHVGEQLVLVRVTGEGDEGTPQGPSELVGLDPDDGEVRWVVGLDAEEQLGDVVVDDEAAWAVLESGGSSTVELLGADGRQARTELDGTAHLVPQDGQLLVVAAGVAARIEGEAVRAVDVPLVGLGLVGHDGGVTALFTDPDGAGEIAVTFAGR